MPPITVYGSVVRALNASSRYTRLLLFRVAPKSLAVNVDECEDQPNNDVRPYILLRDIDCIYSADPRLVYAVSVEVLENFQPRVLDGSARAEQMRPKNTKFAADPSGRALVYKICEITDITIRFPRAPINGLSIVKAMSSSKGKLFANAFKRSGTQYKRARTSLGDIDSVLRRVPGINVSDRRLVHEAFGDAFACTSGIELCAQSAGTPSSLMRLSAVETQCLITFINDVQTNEQEAKKGKHADLQYIRAIPALIGRYADAFLLSCTGVSRRLKTPARGTRLLTEQMGAGVLQAIDMFVNNLRVTSSTCGLLDVSGGDDDDDDDDAGGELLELLHSTNTLIPLAQTGNGVGEKNVNKRAYTTGRDNELEREAARILVSGKAFSKTIALTYAGSSIAGDFANLRSRLAFLGVATQFNDSVRYIVPTPAHASVVPFDALSVSDILYGRYSRKFAPSTICILFAHAFGTETFVRCVRALYPLYASMYGGNELPALVLIGDHLDANGSPREGDRGCIFRDVCACIRRSLIPNGVLEPFFGISCEGELGPLSVEEHAALRAYDSPQLPDAHACVLSRSFSALPLHVRSAGLVLVGTNKYYDALECVGSASDAHTLDKWVCFDELGQISRISHVACADSVGDPFEQPVNVMPSSSSEPAKGFPLQRRNGYVVLTETVASKIKINHIPCCRTRRRNIACLGIHAQTRSLAGSPARALARVTPAPIADELAFIVTPKTGIEDFRAAFALVSKRLYIVCENGEETIYTALNRHAPRPRTRLVSLIKEEREQFRQSGVFPCALLHFDEVAEASCAPLVHANDTLEVIPTPFALIVHGQLTPDTAYSHAKGVEQDGSVPKSSSPVLPEDGNDDRRLFVPISACREVTFEHWMQDVKDKAQAAEVPDGSFIPLTVNGNDDDDDDDDDNNTARAHDSCVREPPPTFRPESVDKNAMLMICVNELDSHVNQRFKALVCAHRSGALGDDYDEHVLQDAADSYPPPLPEITLRIGLGKSRLLRTREAAAVHMLCVIVKGIGERWFVEAERLFALRRHGNEKWANVHADRIKQYLDDVHPPPVDYSDEMRHIDTHNFYSKIHNLRSYIESKLNKK